MTTVQGNDTDELGEWIIDPEPVGDDYLTALLDEHNQREAETGPADNEPNLTEPPDTAELNDLWTARTELARICQFARHRRAAPWAVLGVVLSRLIASLPPGVMLPPLTGGNASLNLFTGLVAPSGGGKGAAEATGSDVLDLPAEYDAATLTPGSGEGIGHAFAERKQGKIVQHTDRVLFSVPEVDTLTALSQRRGATLLSELRKAWIGEALGFGYADPSRRLLLARHAYRLCLILGIQPGRAAPLLDDADGGTPQRFLWLPATDPDAPDEPPDNPGSISVDLRHLWDAKGRVILGVCDQAIKTLDAVRLTGLRGQQDAAVSSGLAGHDGLNRLKVAAALALLAGRRLVTDEDWQLSGIVAHVSIATREKIRTDLGEVSKQRNRARAEADADRAIVVEDRQAEAATVRVARALRRNITGEWQPAADLRRRLNSRDRGYFQDGLDRLMKAGELDVQDSERGTAYRLSEKP